MYNELENQSKKYSGENINEHTRKNETLARKQKKVHETGSETFFP